MKRILFWISLLCILVWSLVLLLDYWQYHGMQRQAVQLFSFGRLLISVGLIMALLAVATHFLRDRLAPWVTGLSILGLAIVFLILSVQSFFRVNTGEPLASYQVIQLIGSNLYTAGIVFFVFTSAYTLGDLFLGISRFARRSAYYHWLRFGVGIMVMTTLMFVLGLFDALLPGVAWGLIILFPILNYRRTIWFLRTVFLKPIRGFKSINALGVVSFCCLLWWAVLNLVFVNRPFPLGFDAMTLYVNVSSLIADYNGLVAGNGLYNWSIFSSLGFLMLDSTEITLGISFGGGLLALFALYAFAKKYVNPNLALMTCAIFYAMPLTNWLSYKDMKIDMPLLFFLLLLLMIMEELLTGDFQKKVVRVKTKTKKVKSSKRKAKKSIWIQWKKPASWQMNLSKAMDARWSDRSPELSLVILIGLLSGFAVGMKLTAILAIFALLSGLFYRIGGLGAFVASASLFLGMGLLIGMDKQPGLRYYNVGGNVWQWVFLGAGAIGLVYYLWSRKEASVKTIRQVFIIGIFSGFMIMPWIGKNAAEGDSISLDVLLNGKSQTPTLNAGEIRRIYNSLENPVGE